MATCSNDTITGKCPVENSPDFKECYDCKNCVIEQSLQKSNESFFKILINKINYFFNMDFW